MASSGLLRRVLLIGLLAGAVGCSAQRIAVNQFSEEFSCPGNRITVSERPPQPPPDIAADPERLKLYKETHPREFLVRGCNTERKILVSTRRDPRDDSRP